MNDEIWKVIDGFDNYKISNLGRIKSIYQVNNVYKFRYKKEKILHPCNDGGGYLFIGLRKDGKTFRPKMHRLVAQAFIDNPNNYPHINHINGIKSDNKTDNLEWCTIQQNNNHYNLNLRTFKYDENKIIKDYKEFPNCKIVGQMNNISSQTARRVLNKNGISTKIHRRKILSILEGKSE